MITIEKPSIDRKQDVVIISSVFSVEGDCRRLWFSVPKDYERYLVTENLDSFVVGLLFLGLKRGSDIYVKGSISARLFYSLNHYLIDALCLANPDLKKISIMTDEISDINLNIGHAAGAGFSCGVDSFATYYDHLHEKGSNKIKFFTFFNAGSHGDFGGDNSRKIFWERLKLVEQFADTVGKKVIAIDSNISEILDMDFLKTNTLRNASCALLLQKLFKNYYVASKNRFDFYKLHPYNNQDYDMLTLPHLCTESLFFFSAVSHLNRIERTALISEFEGPKFYLDVCTNPGHSGIRRNCSCCDKCLRTMFTLELLGKLNEFNQVFDTEIFKKYRSLYIGKLIATKKSNQFHSEIFKFMKAKNKIPPFLYINLLKYHLKTKKKKMKKSLKSAFSFA